jgi:hypothetical protein
MGPADDPTSLGAILISMGIISNEQLDQATEEQRAASPDEMLGAILIANRHITDKQLDMALSAQHGLRSTAKSAQAMANAEIAHTGVLRVMAMAARIRQKSTQVRDDVRKKNGSNGG